MSRLTKDALLGASDLVEREVELPSIGGSVLVRSLPAQYSNDAITQALRVEVSKRGEQTSRVDTSKLESLKVLRGVIDPKFDTIEEVNAFAQQVGPAWQKIIETIDEISGITKEAVEKTAAMFQTGGTDAGRPVVGNGTHAGDSGSDLPMRTGA
jgi:hypothetical protein